MEHPIEGLIKTTMEKIREMVDVDTIIGDPITISEGVVIVPVSKVSFGFASGGSDLPAKTAKDLFGGGGGAGISIQPVAFLVVSNGDVKLLQMSMNANTPNAIINMVPEMFDKISSLFNKKDSDENGEKTQDKK
ncbi:MAG TPA: GerW family sporulation protein [Oscillospiraceae bacterium]|jgi:sporulation protein YtfJ|nr:sporulation protein YtfJ [Oscillospiraceae bacterium]HOV41236.1 GerW family sporulation protein [Oscillospiraceae bacterium]